MIAVFQIILIGVGLFLLMKGAVLLVEGAIGFADRFHIPPLITGLTLVAMGTSTPEAAVSIMGAWKENVAISIGDVIGSNIVNILLILGISALGGTLYVERSTVFCELPYLILVTCAFLGFGLQSGELSRTEGILCWIGFGIYLCYLVYCGRKKGKSEPKGWLTERKETSLFGDLLRTGVGLVVVFLSSEVIVDAATILSRSMGLTDRLIGLTVVALATSMPELFATAAAVRKRHAEIAIGTVIGSNIFNLLCVMGTIAIIRPIPFERAFAADVGVVIGSAILLWICTVRKRRLTQKTGIVLLLCYVGYVMFRVAG